MCTETWKASHKKKKIIEQLCPRYELELTNNHCGTILFKVFPWTVYNAIHISMHISTLAQTQAVRE